MVRTTFLLVVLSIQVQRHSATTVDPLIRQAPSCHGHASLAAAVLDAEMEKGQQVHLLQTKVVQAAPPHPPQPALHVRSLAEVTKAAGFEEQAFWEHELFRPEGFSRTVFFLRIALFFFSLLLFFGLYEGVGRWWHWLRFRACQTSIQRIHQSMLNPGSARAVCPYCLEFLPAQKSPSKVVFHCGHSFHFRCMNRCYASFHKTGLCPICDSDPGQKDLSTEPAACVDGDGECQACQECAVDEAQRFILMSLQRRYPEFISEDCIKIWAAQHTEMWLSELEYKSYRSAQ